MSTDTQTQLRQMRTLIQEMGWKQFMQNVGSIMAEQADKTIGDQSAALFGSSRTIHALHEPWTACGYFKYPDNMVNIPTHASPKPRVNNAKNN